MSGEKMRQRAVCRTGHVPAGTAPEPRPLPCGAAQDPAKVSPRPQIVEVPMRVNVAAVVLSAIAAVVLATSWPAEAAQKKRRLAVEQPTRTVYYNAAGRRVVVIHRRSYLDAGNEPNPGERSYITNILTPTYSATAPIDPVSGRGCCFPLPGPFEPGYAGFWVR
jgi:hypothetical protein